VGQLFVLCTAEYLHSCHLEGKSQRAEDCSEAVQEGLTCSPEIYLEDAPEVVDVCVAKVFQNNWSLK